MNRRLISQASSLTGKTLKTCKDRSKHNVLRLLHVFKPFLNGTNLLCLLVCAAWLDSQLDTIVAGLRNR